MKDNNKDLSARPQTQLDGILSSFFLAYGRFGTDIGESNSSLPLGKLWSNEKNNNFNLGDEFKEVKRRREYLNEYWKKYMPKEKYLTIAFFRQRIFQDFFEEIFKECERRLVKKEDTSIEQLLCEESFFISDATILSPRSFRDYESGNKTIDNIKNGLLIPCISYYVYQDGDFDSLTYYVLKNNAERQNNGYVIYYFEFGDLFFKKADWFGITEEVVRRMWIDSTLMKTIKSKMEEEIFENRNARCSPEILNNMIKQEIESRIDSCSMQ